MPSSPFPLRQKLSLRLTVFALFTMLACIGALAFYSSNVLRDDMQRVLGEQQLSSVSFLASAIDHELGDRIRALELTAKAVPERAMHRPAELQSYLAARMLLHPHFNGGVYFVGQDGTALVERPSNMGRVGRNFLGVDAVAAALHEGRTGVSRPYQFRVQQNFEFEMAVAVRDASGAVTGALVGVTELGGNTFLDELARGHFGTAGSYFVLADKTQRFVITASAGLLSSKTLSNDLAPLAVRFLQGYEGSGVMVNARGVEVLASAKGIPASNWVLFSALPTSEAFAPIRVLQKRLTLATIVLGALACAFMWWMIRRMLAPLTLAANALDERSEVGDLHLPLVSHNEDEIGRLIKGFNALLFRLAQRDQALRESEERYRTAFTTSPDAVNINRLSDGLYMDANDGFLRMIGWSRDEVIGKTSLELNIWRRAEDRSRLVAGLKRDGFFENLEAEFVAKDGHIITALMSAHTVTLKGEVCTLSVTRDITERKAAECELRKLSMAVEQSPESIVITNLRAEIEYVNSAFVHKTGYSREEAIGQNPRILHSGKTHPSIFQSMWSSLASGNPWQGEMQNRRKDGSEYLELATITPIRQSDGIITHYVAVKEDITAKKAAQEQINDLAFYDPLTRLPNRRLLIERLKQALAASSRHGRKGALLFIDLDNFKDLNDTLGHDTGDQLLQEVGHRLSGCMREGDTVARLGGDEFVVVLEDLSEIPAEAANQAELVGAKILEILAVPFNFDGHERRNSASIGITLFSDHGETIEELLRRADLAMYQAKASGRNALRFFDPEMQAVVDARSALELDLRRAMDAGDFSLSYQAQILGERQLQGVEALLRWKHALRGMVSPAQFIPLAEETGLILPLGHWVLETACHQLKSWEATSDLAHLTIAVNVSARQFHHDDFVENVLDVLVRTGANPMRLKLELTESMLVSNVEDVVAKMTALKTRGVGFSLDDFGTGYSSLSYLKRLPLDQLKIDQGFIRDILTDANDDAITKTVIALARSLGFSVIAEGVETTEQRDHLADLGCHTYQGYLACRPLPIDEFEEMARRAWA